MHKVYTFSAKSVEMFIALDLGLKITSEHHYWRMGQPYIKKIRLKYIQFNIVWNINFKMFDGFMLSWRFLRQFDELGLK